MCRPRLRCFAHVVQVGIVDDQKATLLKVWLRYTPSTPQVFVDPILQQALKRVLVAALAGAVLSGLFGIELLVEPHRLEYGRCDVVMLQSFLLFECLEQRSSEEPYLNEVVEVPRLK